jgi:molecular chaperone GrpE
MMTTKNSREPPEENKVTHEESSTHKWQQLQDEEEAAIEAKQEQVKASMADRSRESLENELVDLRSRLTDSQDRAVRIQAEMQNLRRRLERDMDNAYKFANEKLAGELLPVLDSLTRGIDAAPDNLVKQGMELTLNLLKGVMEKHGVKEIVPVLGDLFNPQYHEAMMMIPMEGGKSNTVAAVMQPGFELNGRVLRAAMVSLIK